MRKNKLKVFSIVALGSIFQACEVDDANHQEDFQNNENEIIIQEVDHSRLNRSELGVVGIKEIPENATEMSPFNPSNEENLTSDLPLINNASVNPPVIGSTILKATHVALHDNYAYVSYNVEGSQYMGAIDVIDVSDPNSPVLASQALLPNTDVNSIAYHNGNLFVAGANASINEDGTNPALLYKIELQQGLPTSSYEVINMPSFAGLDVCIDENNIYGISGDNGVLAQYDQNGILQNMVSVADLRAVGIYNNQIIALSGTSGIHIYNTNNLNESLNFATSQDLPEAKRTIAFYEGHVLVSEGAAGVGVYNLSTGNQISSLPLPDLNLLEENIDPTEVVTNAVSTLDDHILVAQGAAGVSLFGAGNGIANTINMGVLNLNGSANFVKGEGAYIFVADGSGGLKILKRLVAEDGTGAGTIVCEDYPPYTAGPWMNINSNQPQNYSGSASVNGVNVNDELIFCGSLAVSGGLNINSNGSFYMSGALVQGNTSNPWNSLNINSNALLQMEGSMTLYGNLNLNGGTLQVNGDLTIHGNLILNAGSSIEFQGNNNTITVLGDVIQNGNNNITISGNFTDTENKF